MITTPPVYSPVHKEEVDYKNPTTEEAIKKIIANNNFLLDLSPIGTIIFINTNQYGGGQPNFALWQICDGSEITNPNSPIRSIGLNQRFTPNLKDRYLKGANASNLNPTGGSQLHNLAHGHSTGGPSAEGGGMQDKGDRRRRETHDHE